MGRPRKDPTSTSSPQPATAASKTTPAALPSSTSATPAKATAVGSRSRSALAAEAAGPSQGAKPNPTQPRPTASRGAKSDSTQPRPTASRGSKSDSTEPRPTASRGAKSDSTQPRPAASRGAKSDSTQPRPTSSRGNRGDAGDQHTVSAGSCSATQKKPPDAKRATGPARPDPHLQKQQPGAESSEAWSQFLPPLERQDIPWVEKETRGQRNNPNWYKWRENRITASVAPKIANSKFANNKTTEVPQSYLKAVVSSSPGVQTAAMAWGIRKEKAAVKAYEQMKSQALGKPVWVDDCGLFIHRDKNWIAASPDGIIKEVATGRALGLLEVKCPYKHRNRTVREACKDKDFCLELDGDSYALKKDHAYFTQVQCQLAAADFQRADFVVHTTKETAVVPVEFDAEFWWQTVPKLEKFYTEAVIPYLEEKANGSVWAKEE
ncbi:probable serine/threonine-protein kinase samkC [Athene cunicularia]|uniref:probable serine/threonine-protein kinase samkC n=1 Tax=Athene cunicularia TaxID=194338 RepID=UPI000EF69AFC|nr:probable serine/threonine-protein kinase samkC [Athene cunicularia]